MPSGIRWHVLNIALYLRVSARAYSRAFENRSKNSTESFLSFSFVLFVGVFVAGLR